MVPEQLFVQLCKIIDTKHILGIEMNKKGIIELSVKCKTIRLLEGNIGENLGEGIFR